jgi:phosphonate transport system ATP-binding protein
MSTAPAIELAGLSAPAAPLARTPAVQALDLRVEAGEQVAVIGASGAGKTSLLLAIAAAVRPLQGSVRLFGEDPWAMSPAERQRLRARLFLAPQVSPLPPRQRVATAVLAGGLPHGHGGLGGWWRGLVFGWPEAQARRAHAALQAFDVGDKLWQRVDRLSGGERQRIGLARALVSQASLWLVDEPLSALDPQRAAQAIASLQDAARANGCSLVCTLHPVDVARERFARIVALQAGRIVYDGPSAGLDADLLDALYRGEAAASSSPAAPPPGAPAGPPGTLCR